MASFDESIQRTFGGSAELFKEVAEVFLKTYVDYVAQIEKAIQEKDFLLLEHAAHSLKGSLLPFGFDTCAESAAALEKIGRAKAFTGNETVQIQALKEEIGAARRSLESFLNAY